jgi:hypothetical protein
VALIWPARFRASPGRERLEKDRSVCANQPDLNGFDIVAFAPASRSALEAIVARCHLLGIFTTASKTPRPARALTYPTPTALSFAYQLTDTTD